MTTRHHIYLDYAKLGKGPLYSFYTPYHLYHFEVPISIARVALFGDTVLATEGPIRVEVIATAKRDLKAGETLDGLGGFMTYGECENAWVSGPRASADGDRGGLHACPRRAQGRRAHL
jgi:predicted homoserine dehydrogenase-like protein